VTCEREGVFDSCSLPQRQCLLCVAPSVASWSFTGCRVYVYELAEQGLVYCQCGNYNIEIDVFPDRMELQCKKCNGVSIIYAETEEDLSIVQQVDELELIKDSLGFLDSLAHPGVARKNRYQHD